FFVGHFQSRFWGFSSESVLTPRDSHTRWVKVFLLFSAAVDFDFSRAAIFARRVSAVSFPPEYWMFSVQLSAFTSSAFNGAVETAAEADAGDGAVCGSAGDCAAVTVADGAALRLSDKWRPASS